jgi:pimeloyl-ACP methyl ester carboxylesterase
MFTSPDGTRIACEKTGHGPPLLLVHGGTADHTRWTPVLPALCEHHTCFAMDRRGRGGSTDKQPYSIEREFEDIAAVIDQIGGPVDVIGHSHGAWCSLEAARRAKSLHRLVLYEPPFRAGLPIYDPATVQTLRDLLAAGDRSGVITMFMRDIVRVPAPQLAAMQRLPAWTGRVAAAHTIVREIESQETYTFDPQAFATMRTPTLVLLGSDSPAFFKAAVDKVMAALPNAQLAVLAGQQHAAMDTGPRVFLDAVLPFLAAG